MSVAKSKTSVNTSNTPRKWLIILVMLLLISLGLIQQTQAEPSTSLRLLTSKYRNYAKWLNAMAKYETGNYSNTLSTDYNNIFSMGYPTKRPSVNQGSTPLAGSGPGEPDLFSVYKSRDQAIQDMILWLEYHNFPTGLTRIEDFIAGLKSHTYFTQDESTYLEGVKRWL